MCALVESGPAVASFGGGIAELVPRHELLERLHDPKRVTLLSAPAGSGKTVLLRAWLGEMAVADSVAWVGVGREERDPQRFWLSVLDALRDTCAGSALVRALSAAPEVDGWGIVEQLLEDIDSLNGRLWLVIDDLHELRSDEALRQLELLLMRAPGQLRFVLATRHDLPLGLHRMRLGGELTEIRTDALRFTIDQARELFEAAGVVLSDSALSLLHERTEGWAAGLRLAAVSLANHPDPERFAAEFSGSERTVAEYLLAEVLERQPEPVRRLLLRTSMLDRVSGPLADHLLGGLGAERTLHELEAANAFVVALDARRQWFRYHNLFADLLALELRRTEPGELASLHRGAAEWFAEHEHPVEAVRHAQAAEEWTLASSLLTEHWISLQLDGNKDTAHELVARFPAVVVIRDPALIAMMASDELGRGQFQEGERLLALATSEVASLPAEQRGRVEILLSVLRLSLFRQRGDLPAVAEEARRLLVPVEVAEAVQLAPGKEPRALALLNLGAAEAWAQQNAAAERHLEQGVALARKIQRPYLELFGLVHGGRLALNRSYALGIQRSTQAIELAARHGWSEVPLAGIAYTLLASALVGRGQFEEAEGWAERATRTLRAEVEPVAGMLLQQTRAALELAHGRPSQTLDALAAGERVAELLTAPTVDVPRMHARALQAHLRLGQTERVQAALADMDERERGAASMRSVVAALKLAEDDPQAATVALAPVLSGSVPAGDQISMVEALVLEAIAQEALGDTGAAWRAIERALDVAETDGIVLPFFLHPVRELLERHCSHQTSHACLAAELSSLLAGKRIPPRTGSEHPHEPLSESETRVLRYLPTNLSLRDIGNELYVSVHTVKTHVKHIYAKLGAHGRAEAVERARSLGLLAPSAQTRHKQFALDSTQLSAGVAGYR